MKSKNRTLIGIMALAVAVSGCSVIGSGGGKKKSKTPVLGDRIAILTSESGVEVDPAMAGISVLLPPAVINDSWGQPGGNASKSMEHVAVPQALGAAWKVDIAGTTKRARLAASPVVANGRVYVADTSAKIRSIDAQSGNVLWTVDFGATGRDSASQYGGGVSVDGDFVYVTNGLGDVAALKASDGSQIWKKRPGGPLRGAPTLSGNSLYVMSQDNQIFALNATTGEVEWNEAAAIELAGVFGVAAPAVAQGTIVAGFSSGELNAYRYENGRAVWGDALSRTSISTSVSTLADIDAMPVIDRGRVFAIGQGGRMVSLELVTGQRLWEINVAGISTPWVSGEWLFVVDDEARMLCISRGTGKVRWISQLPRWDKEKKKKGVITWTGPILAGGRLIVASSDGRLANIDPADGRLQSVTKAGGPIYLPPIVANNTLFILDNSGNLSAWR
jgi:outer membrane protein assembly factor BamB